MPSPERIKEIKELLRQKKQEKRAILQQEKEYRNANLIEFFNKPKDEDGLPANPLQAELLEAFDNPEYKIFTFVGANRTGKTTIGAIVAISFVLGRWPWNNQKIHFSHSKPRKVRYIGQDWKSQIEKVVIPEIKKWWPKKVQVETRGNGIVRDSLWEHKKTGGTIELMSNYQDSDVHEGWSGDLIVYDEPPKREIRVANARGLIDRQGYELFCMTLLKEAWVDREVIRAVDDSGKPDRTIFSVSGDIWQNVGYGITNEGIDQFAKTLNDAEKDARLRGIPSYMGGLVLPFFKRNIHIRERFDIPSTWPVDIAIDIHPRKEQAVLFIATSPQQLRYLCFEIWEHGDGPQTADKIVRIAYRYALRVNRIICDPLAKGDGNNENTTYDKMQNVFAMHGHYLETATKDKVSGILEINNHLEGPNKEPSLFVFRDLVRTIHNIEGWMYEADTQKPSKTDDDMCENLYRLLLLGTTYTEDDEYESEEYEVLKANAMTGY